MAKSKKSALDRRRFLKTAMGSATALAAPTAIFESKPARASVGVPTVGRAMPLLPPLIEDDPSPEVAVLTEGSPGSDFMIDVIKSLGFDYVCSVAGSSFRGLHESLLNYGGNQNPEFITCCHEESSVAMGHGYAKIEGKPLCVFAHGTVGLQHAAMAIYNAYCDRVPVYIMVGNTLDANTRNPGYGEWYHSVQDAALIVRDYTKWDDMPLSLPHFAESAVRAYKIAMTPPMGPVLLVVDSDLQERTIPEGTKPYIPKVTLTQPPQGDSGSVAEAARLLVKAENPVIVVDRTARTQAGVDLLLELAETLQAPVIDKFGRMNFPSRHPLNQSARSRSLIAEADVILGLEVADFWATLHSFHDATHRTWRPVTRPGVKLIRITADDLYIKANYQEFRRFTEVDLDIGADAETTMPSLIEAVKRQITSERKTAFQARGTRLSDAHFRIREQTLTEATYGWDASPISTARLAAELWEKIKNEDWSLPAYVKHSSWWPLRLWNFSKHYQYIGTQGGGGIGYNAPACVGAALANRKHGRISINIQDDGDLLFAPAILWTAAHHKIPLLTVMHNNRAYHEELMHIQRMANRYNRGVDRAHIGTTFEDPNVDFAKIAQGFGMYAEGPIADPKELGSAIDRALAVVKKGEPALLDVVTQPR